MAFSIVGQGFVGACMIRGWAQVGGWLDASINPYLRGCIQFILHSVNRTSDSVRGCVAVVLMSFLFVVFVYLVTSSQAWKRPFSTYRFVSSLLVFSSFNCPPLDRLDLPFVSLALTFYTSSYANLLQEDLEIDLEGADRVSIQGQYGSCVSSWYQGLTSNQTSPVR